MRKIRILFSNIILLSLVSILFISCPTNQKFGADADYFVGLQKLNDGKIKEAKQKFSNCVKNGTYYCAKESAKQLASLGNLQEKNEASIFLYQNFPDEDSLLILAKAYNESKEIRKLLEITNDIDFATAQNELIILRLKALLQLEKNDQFKDEVYKWFTSRTVSQESYQFYRDVYSPLLEEELSPQEQAIQYRIILYRRDYLSGFSQAKTFISFFEDESLEPNAQLASDIGKSFLYGSDEFVNNASYLEKKADLLKETPVEFYFWFYAGRLYDSANLYYTKAINSYEKAIKSTTAPDKIDNAAWYLLMTKLKLSLDDTLSSIQEYARIWNDPEYFDDIFDTLIPSLIVNKKWNSLGQLLQNVDGYVTKEVEAQLSYIYARILEENYLILDISEEERESLIKGYYEKALDSGTSAYYRILAAYRLNYSGDKLEQVLGSGPNTFNNTNLIISKKGQTIDLSNLDDNNENIENLIDQIQVLSPKEILLQGYAYFGFPEKIYNTWLELNSNGVSSETGFYLSEFLNKCGKQNNNYYVQALRIAARVANISTSPMTKQELMNVYPTNFEDLVDTYSKKYDINKSVVYALIRSESFFDQNVVSSAGAVGLTQLMNITAEEIAQKLRVSEYSLTDPEININFGTYYLSELIRRRDGSILGGLFSYNAGFKKVTTWLESSIMDIDKEKNLSMDLFLEAIPYSETRNYGRKLLGATVMYEYLYGDLDFTEIVESLLK